MSDNNFVAFGKKKKYNTQKGICIPIVICINSVIRINSISVDEG